MAYELTDVELRAVHDGDPHALMRSQVRSDLDSDLEEERRAQSRWHRLCAWLCCAQRKREQRARRSKEVAVQLFD